MHACRSPTLLARAAAGVPGAAQRAVPHTCCRRGPGAAWRARAQPGAPPPRPPARARPGARPHPGRARPGCARQRRKDSQPRRNATLTGPAAPGMPARQALTATRTAGTAGNVRGRAARLAGSAAAAGSHGPALSLRDSALVSALRGGASSAASAPKPDEPVEKQRVAATPSGPRWSTATASTSSSLSPPRRALVSEAASAATVRVLRRRRACNGTCSHPCETASAP